jgi:hypothetical protein
MSDITDAGARLRAMNDALEDPMAWLAFATDGSESCAVYMTGGEAKAAADAWGWQVMPLYLAPRLTDEEREAIESAIWDYEQNADDEDCARMVATLRGLLERFSHIAKRESDSSQAIADARLAALQALAELDEELGLPRTPTPPSTPDKCSVPTGCIEGGGK